MDEKKHKLIIDGNAFYEMDLECQRQKEKKKKIYTDNKNRQTKRQRS